MLASEDGSLVIKPSLASEIAFYQQISSNDTYASLRPLIPKFLGTLKLQGEVTPAPTHEGDGVIKLLREVVDQKDMYSLSPSSSSVYTWDQAMLTRTRVVITVHRAREYLSAIQVS